MLYFRKGATAKYFIHWPLLARGATIVKLIRVLSSTGFCSGFLTGVFSVQDCAPVSVAAKSQRAPRFTALCVIVPDMYKVYLTEVRDRTGRRSQIQKRHLPRCTMHQPTAIGPENRGEAENKEDWSTARN